MMVLLSEDAVDDFYPLHQGMDVTTFRWSLNAGAAGLLLAGVWSAILSRRAARSAPEP